MNKVTFNRFKYNYINNSLQIKTTLVGSNVGANSCSDLSLSQRNSKIETELQLKQQMLETKRKAEEILSGSRSPVGGKSPTSSKKALYGREYDENTRIYGRTLYGTIIWKKNGKNGLICQNPLKGGVNSSCFHCVCQVLEVYNIGKIV